jgi:hypothetical protein
MWLQSMSYGVSGLFEHGIGIDAMAEKIELPDDVLLFIKYVTLHLQRSRSRTPEQNDAMFRQAYRLYVKYDVERGQERRDG